MSAAIYHGNVTHRRLRPVGHRFSYRVFSMLIDVDRIDEAAARLRLFSRNRFNVFSFYDRDHGSEGPVGECARRRLRIAGFRADGKILLLCYPRILGYVFNPLSVYYCHDADGRLDAVLYEVRNTFGERHVYAIAAGPDRPIVRQQADKEFFVSPFMDMEHRYEFRLSEPADALSLNIRQSDAAGPIFYASFAGVREAMTDGALVRAFFRYPLMTVKIIAAIHWEAARLLAKGLRLRKRPARAARPGDSATETRLAAG